MTEEAVSNHLRAPAQQLLKARGRLPHWKFCFMSWAMGALLLFSSPVDAASVMDELPREISQEDKTDCAGKPGEHIDISMNCYYAKLQYEIRRNQKIREIISRSLEEMVHEFSESSDVVSHFSQAHKFWLAYGEMTCETVPREISQNISKYEIAEETGCWLDLYHVYTENLLRGYGQVVLREYNRAQKGNG